MKGRETMSKFLIINADDYGYNEQQNAAVAYLAENHLITSVSAMAVADKIDEATKRGVPSTVSCGVHLTINSDSAENPWYALSDKRMLPHDSKKLTFGTTHEYVRSELESQYVFLVNNGMKIDHADNHCGTLYGINGRRFYIDAFDFCKCHSLPYRFPKTSGFIDRQLGRKTPSPVRALQNMIVTAGEKRQVKMLDDLASNPYNVARIGSFENLRKYYLDLVDNCIDGVTEIFLHPAMPLNGEQGEWQKRVWEYEILKSGCLLERAKEKDIRTVSWDVFNQL